MKAHLVLFGFIMVSELCLITPSLSLAAPPPEPNRAPSATVAGPSDAEIVHTFITTNTVETDAAKLAQTKATNKEVKALATQLASEHANLSKQMTTTMKKTPMMPKDNEMSKALMLRAKETMDKLRVLDGKEFDNAYLAHELSFHETFASNLDNNLISNVDENAIKDVLMKARPAVSAHVAQIKKLQADIKKN